MENKSKHIIPRPGAAEIKSAVEADESAAPYPEQYYLYRNKLLTLPKWYKQTYGEDGLKYFKFWHSKLRTAENLERLRTFRMGVQVEKNLILYDDKEWQAIQSAWEKRREWKG